MPPQLTRILPKRAEGPYKVANLSIDDIDKLSDEIEALLPRVEEFGRLALKLAVFDHETGMPVYDHDYRVRDVLGIAGGGKTGLSTTVVRSGPRASQTRGGIYTSLSESEAASIAAQSSKSD